MGELNKRFCESRQIPLRYTPKIAYIGGMEREWLTVEEAAQYLGVERINLYRLIHKQGLPACRKIGRAHV